MCAKQLVIVLGMHRSGTSTITRSLKVMGVELGDRMMPPIEGNNSKGFWEDIDINALNIEMLSTLGNDWHRIDTIHPIAVDILYEQGYLLRAVELLRKKVGNAPVFGFKDPRLAKLLPFWKEVFRYCEFNVNYVMVVRHPLSVAMSLAKRDGVGMVQSIFLWLVHVLTSLRGIDGDKRVFIDYDRLMQSPDHELNRIAKHLDLVIDPAELQDYKINFLDQDLRHTVYILNDLLLSDICPSIVHDVYAALLNVASDKAKPDDLAGKVVRWSREFERFRSPLLLIDSLWNENLISSQILAKRDGQIGSLNQAVSERDGQIKNSDQTISEILKSRSWRITKIFRQVSSIVIELKGIRVFSIARVTLFCIKKFNLSTRTKNTIKNVVFPTLGWFFSKELSYRAWEKGQQDKKKGSEHLQNRQCINHIKQKYKSKVGAKNILIINDTTPTPDRDAGSLDVYYFIKAFIELGYNTTFIPDDLRLCGHYTENLRNLGACCITSEDVESIETFLKKEGFNFEVVVLYRIHTARRHFPIVKLYATKAKIIFDTVDLHYLREERQAVIDNSSDAKLNASHTKAAEFELMRGVDATIVLSSIEHDMVLDHDPSINVFTIPLIRNIPGCKSVYLKRKDIIFIGGFLHSPNVHSVKYFVSKIWPIVRMEMPDVEFIILGSNPPAEILDLSKMNSRIQVIGFVEDIDPYFDTCRISVAPICYGAGIKGKIATSASYGVPSVATSLAVEGMGLVDGIDVLVADDPAYFARRVVELYKDEALWDKLSVGGLNFVKNNYSYELGKSRLQNLLNTLA